MLCKGRANGLRYCVWVGVDSVWEQEKLKARKMLLNRADSHLSGARFVGLPFAYHNACFRKLLNQQTNFMPDN